MSNELLNYSRSFQVWEYTVGHKQLLLRSPKAPGLSTRVDILFKNVAGIHLPTALEGLTISEVAESDRGSLELQWGAARLEGRKLFVVRGLNFVGYVIAGVMAWHEDEGEYYEPSYFRLKPI